MVPLVRHTWPESHLLQGRSRGTLASTSAKDPTGPSQEWVGGRSAAVPGMGALVCEQEGRLVHLLVLGRNTDRFRTVRIETILFQTGPCSVAKSRLTLCNPVNCSTPGFPVLHDLPEFAQTHVH